MRFAASLRSLALTLSLCWLVFAPSLAGAQTFPGDIKIETIESDILGRAQEIYVYEPKAPPAPEIPQAALPVVIVFDAEHNFLPAVGVAATLQRANLLPDLIFVGLPGGATREYDYSPTHIDVDYMQTGGGPDYLRFLEQELLPHIAESRQVSDHVTLVGHSLSALFSWYALAERPKLIGNVVSISPSFWWEDGALSKRILDRIRKNKFTRLKSVFFSMADEAALSDPNGAFMAEEMLRVYSALEQKGVKNLDAAKLELDNEDHLTTVNPSLHKGLAEVFSHWNLDAAYETGDLKQLTTALDRNSAIYGFEVAPSYTGIVNMGSAKHQAGEYDQAVEIYAFGRRYYPDGLQLAAFLARSLAALERYDEALEIYHDALRIAESTNSPMQSWVKDRISETEEKMGN